jgi:DNA-directed RNA polymerase specialized sigma24 family protein
MKHADRTTVQPERCSPEDYRSLFHSNAESLLGLCRTLTGDERRARLSFDNALNRCVESANVVFREWMLSWARRLIIKSCIAAMRSEIQSAAHRFSASTINRPLPETTRARHLSKMAPEELETKLLRADTLCRFVVVLRVVENYSRRETALLLDVDEIICTSAHLWACAATLNSMPWPEGYPENGMTNAYSGTGEHRSARGR